MPAGLISLLVAALLGACTGGRTVAPSSVTTIDASLPALGNPLSDDSMDPAAPDAIAEDDREENQTNQVRYEIPFGLIPRAAYAPVHDPFAAAYPKVSIASFDTSRVLLI